MNGRGCRQRPVGCSRPNEGLPEESRPHRQHADLRETPSWASPSDGRDRHAPRRRDHVQRTSATAPMRSSRACRRCGSVGRAVHDPGDRAASAGPAALRAPRLGHRGVWLLGLPPHKSPRGDASGGLPVARGDPRRGSDDGGMPVTAMPMATPTKVFLADRRVDDAARELLGQPSLVLNTPPAFGDISPIMITRGSLASSSANAARDRLAVGHLRHAAGLRRAHGLNLRRHTLASLQRRVGRLRRARGTSSICRCARRASRRRPRSTAQRGCRSGSRAFQRSSSPSGRYSPVGARVPAVA